MVSILWSNVEDDGAVTYFFMQFKFCEKKIVTNVSYSRENVNLSIKSISIDDPGFLVRAIVALRRDLVNIQSNNKQLQNGGRTIMK